MKYTICGFNQNKMIEFSMDIIDAHLLRYFIDFKDTGKMIAEIFDNKPYYWIKYETVIEELPTLKLKSKDSVYRRYKNMCKSNILMHKTRKDSRGTYSFYAVGEKYQSLISDTGYGLKSERGTDKNPDLNIPLLKKDPSIKSYLHVLSDHERIFDEPVKDYIKVYLDIYRHFRNKDHVRVSESNLFDINSSIRELITSSIDLEEFREKTIDYFQSLPQKNNGSIISFLTGSYRIFDVYTEFSKSKKKDKVINI